MPPLIPSLCSHIYAVYLYDEIGAGRSLMAYTKSKENEKYAMMVGHLSRENPIGVFYATTDYEPGVSAEHERLQDFLHT